MAILSTLGAGWVLSISSLFQWLKLLKPSPQTSPSWGEKATADPLLLPKLQGHYYKVEQHSLLEILYAKRHNGSIPNGAGQ